MIRRSLGRWVAAFRGVCCWMCLWEGKVSGRAEDFTTVGSILKHVPIPPHYQIQRLGKIVDDATTVVRSCYLRHRIFGSTTLYVRGKLHPANLANPSVREFSPDHPGF